MLGLNEEYNQWLKNYEILLDQMRAAYRFKNKKAIEDLSKRIVVVQWQIASCARRLKKEGYSHSKGIIRSPVGTYVKVREYTPMNFDRIDRGRMK